MAKTDEILDIVALEVFEDLLGNEPCPEQQALNVTAIAGEGAEATGVGMQEVTRHVEVVALGFGQIFRWRCIVDLSNRVKTRRRRTAYSGYYWLPEQ